MVLGKQLLWPASRRATFLFGDGVYGNKREDRSENCCLWAIG